MVNVVYILWCLFEVPSHPSVEMLGPITIDLRKGIDSGGPVTASGRLKRIRFFYSIFHLTITSLTRYVSRDDEEDALSIQEERSENTKVSKPTEFPFKRCSYHIRRAFDLYGNIHTIINDGIKRQAIEELGEVTTDFQ